MKKTRKVDAFFNFHLLVSVSRCQSFKVKRGEICKIPGCSVSPSAPGTPVPVRLPHYQGETFKQFIAYIYTGKVRTKACLGLVIFLFIFNNTKLELILRRLALCIQILYWISKEGNLVFVSQINKTI